MGLADPRQAWFDASRSRLGSEPQRVRHDGGGVPAADPATAVGGRPPPGRPPPRRSPPGCSRARPGRHVVRPGGVRRER
jgi:hypothetical protein